jgi:Zn-dependent M28 family amino/carboxypeptidase
MKTNKLFIATLLIVGGTHASPLTAADAHVFVPEIVGEDFAAHIKTLASDEFSGRRPGTAGEQKTMQYLFDQFQHMGLAPGNGDSYFQKVPVQVRLADFPNSHASVDINGRNLAFAFGPQVVLGSDKGLGDVTLTDSPMVFVGYGINAPEHRWNDYEGVDVKGKTVVILAGEPVGEGADRDIFEGRRLTHYSRYSYKVVEAARQGAVAAIVIHNTKDVGYDWAGVNEKWHRTAFALRAAESKEPILDVEGWIEGESARDLFAANGAKLTDARSRASRRGFKAEAMDGARLSASLKGKIVLGESNNFIARLTGSTRPDEAVLYSAHWDHLGTSLHKSKDDIYNGALDNASGVAALLEIAGRFAAESPKPERSVVFLIPTLEEFGLLGSKYYIQHPIVPLAKTVADINFDMVVPIGKARNFVVIGYGYTELDEIIAPIVARHDRQISGEKNPDSDSFFRSDHLNFARAGVPVMYMRGGTESAGIVLENSAPDETWNRTAAVYHTASDEFNPKWDLRGIADDIEISYEMGRALASRSDWPNYRSGNAFRALRDALRKSSGSASP